ncbi:MAG: hypothetical protein ABL308_11535 [Oceanicaulis sp.]
MKDGYEHPIAVPLFFLASFCVITGANAGEASEGDLLAIVAVLAGVIGAGIALFQLARGILRR